MIKITTPLDNAREAVAILEEVLRTPMMRSLHFALDAEVTELPIVTYTVERFCYKDASNDSQIKEPSDSKAFGESTGDNLEASQVKIINDGTYRGGEE